MPPDKSPERNHRPTGTNASAPGEAHDDRLGALASIAARIGIYTDTHRLAREAMQAVADLLPIRAALLLLQDSMTGSLYYHESINLPSDLLERYHRDMTWDECLEGKAVREKGPILIEDVSADSRAVHYMEGSMSLGLVPLLSRDHAIGVLSVTTTRPHRLDQSDMEFLLTLGSQLGTYIENARLVAELKKSNRLLLQQNQDLEELLSVISHDLRSPLATIGGYASLLIKKGEKLDAQERARFAETIFRKTRETSQRFDDLLHVFRSGFGDEAEPPGIVDVRAVIEEALEEASPGGGTMEGFTIEVPDDLPLLEGYGTHLVHIFSNLFSNAIKFMGERKDPRITVGYERDVIGDEVHHRFRVSDNGRGIPPDYISNIFRPFMRVPTLDEIPGTGVGLTSVQRIVRNHRGTIDVRSVEGEGTTFTFTLPWKEVEQSSAG